MTDRQAMKGCPKCGAEFLGFFADKSRHFNCGAIWFDRKLGAPEMQCTDDSAPRCLQNQLDAQQEVITELEAEVQPLKELQAQLNVLTASIKVDLALAKDNDFAKTVRVLTNLLNRMEIMFPPTTAPEVIAVVEGETIPKHIGTGVQTVLVAHLPGPCESYPNEVTVTVTARAEPEQGGEI